MALVYLTNSYVSDVSEFLDGIADWDAASADEQDQSLVDATRSLDNRYWIGSAVLVTQPLAWPRTGVSFWDPTLGLMVEVADDEIPRRLQIGTAQLALHLLRNPSVLADPYATRYDSITVGPISLSSGDYDSRPPAVPLVPHSVNKLVSPLVNSNSATGGAFAWWRSN
jgi:hypothetical protein